MCAKWVPKRPPRSTSYATLKKIEKSLRGNFRHRPLIFNEPLFVPNGTRSGKKRQQVAMPSAMACWPTSELPARAKGRSLCPDAPSNSSAGACKRRPSYAAEPKAPTVMVCRNAERGTLLQAVTPCSGVSCKNIARCRRLNLRGLWPRPPVGSAAFRKSDPKSHKSQKTELMRTATPC